MPGFFNQLSVENFRDLILNKIADGDIAAIAEIVKDENKGKLKLALNPVLSYEISDYKTSPIHLAIAKGSTEIVRLILPFITNINCQPYSVGTPLHFAVQKQNIDIVNLLLERNDIDLNAKDYWYTYPPTRDATVLKRIIGDIHLRGDESGRRREIARLLLNDERLDPNIRDPLGKTALYIAEKANFTGKNVLEDIIPLLREKTSVKGQIQTDIIDSDQLFERIMSSPRLR